MDFKPFSRKSIEFIRTPFEKDARINILSGSIRSGKTITLLPKLLMYIEEGAKGIIGILGVSKQTIYDNVLRDLFETVGEDNYHYNRLTGDLKIFDRELKVIGARDEGSEKYLRGITLAGAFCDELSLMPELFFKQLLNRLSIEGSKLYATTNPDSPFHYLYREYINNEELKKTGIVKVYNFTLEDNLTLSEEYRNFITSAYTGFFNDRFIKGLWVVADGIIYPQFKKEIHCVNDDYINQLNFQRFFVVCDYGITNPHVYLYCGARYERGLPTVYIIDEYYNNSKDGSKTDVLFLEDYKKFILNKKPIDNFIIDPSATSLTNYFRQNGIEVKLANNDVLPGINNVSMFLTQERLKINIKCTNLIKEITNYVWDTEESKNGIDAPLKENDHAVDCVRYLLNTIYPIKRISEPLKIFNL